MSTEPSQGIYFKVRGTSKEQRQALRDKLNQACDIMELEQAETLAKLLTDALPPQKQK